MRPDSTFGPPKRAARMSISEARCDEALIIIAGDMFAAGFDTKEISIRLVVPESAAWAALQVSRERRRIENIA